MILSVRKNPVIAKVLGIAGILSQESSARTQVELLFQSLDSDDSREITLQEFMAFESRFISFISEKDEDGIRQARRLSVKDMVKKFEKRRLSRI